MRAPREVILKWQGSKHLPVGVAMVSEPVPVRLNIELADFVLRRTIKHSYHAARKPIASWGWPSRIAFMPSRDDRSLGGLFKMKTGI